MTPSPSTTIGWWKPNSLRLAANVIKQKAKAEAEAQGLTDSEEEILRTMAKRGRQPNISFFAFTATPKYKTLEVFGTPGPDSKPRLRLDRTHA